MLVPCTTREQWVSLLVVVNVESEGVHPGPVTSDELYDHDMLDELEAHSRMIRSSWRPMAFFGVWISAAATAATTCIIKSSMTNNDNKKPSCR